MSLQDELLELGKNRLTQVKMVLDELDVQLALGKAEAKETFNRERKNFLNFLSEQKAQVKKTVEASAVHRQELNGRFEALELLLNLETAADKPKFDQQKKDTLHAIYQLEHTMKEMGGSANSLLQARLDGFKATLDAYRISLALAEFEDLENLDNRRNDLKSAVAAIREKLKKEENAGEKIDRFASEAGEAFDHMKKAFSELFS